MRAYHLAQHYDAGRLGDYGLVVCNASMDRAGEPGIWLPSFDAQAMPLWGADSPFWDDMRRATSSHVLEVDGRAVGQDHYRAVLYDYRRTDGARDLARWIAEKAPAGCYIDSLVAELPERHDVPADVRRAYVLWREVLVAELRAANPEAILVANTGGMTDPRLNGICIERSHADRMDHVQAIAAFARQWTQGHKPCLSIDWSGRWEGEELGVLKGTIR